MEVQKRESNFELLRILLILMIITLHYLNSSMGGALNTHNIVEGSVNYNLVRILESLCIVAVNCFLIITGYFMYEKKSVKIGKIIELVLILIFYNALIFGACLLTGEVSFTRKSISIFIKTFIIDGPWFVIIYSILYLMIPYINKIIAQCSKKQFEFLLIILLIFFSIWPTFISNLTVKDGGYGIINFIMLYLIGAYIHKYQLGKHKGWIYLLVYLIMAGITYATTIIKKNGTFDYNSIFNIIGAVVLFLAFSKLNFQSKWINKTAGYVFGIYIIHVNAFIIPILWKKVCHTNLFYNSNYLIVHLIGCTLGIFIVCLVMDVIRKKVFDWIVLKKLKNTKLFQYEIK